MFFRSRRSRLKKYTLDSLPRVPHQGEILPAKIVDVYDGDTFTAIFLYHDKTPFRINIRVFGIDAPEIKGKGVTPLERDAAVCVREYVSNILLDKIVPIQIKSWDKYGGRIVADVYMEKYRSKNSRLSKTISEHLLELQYCKAYTGKGKKEGWSTFELQDIIRRLSS